jgi:hypothetical protein
VHDVVRADQRITIRDVAEEQGIFFFFLAHAKEFLTKDLGSEVCSTAEPKECPLSVL